MSGALHSPECCLACGNGAKPPRQTIGEALSTQTLRCRAPTMTGLCSASMTRSSKMKSCKETGCGNRVTAPAVEGLRWGVCTDLPATQGAAIVDTSVPGDASNGAYLSNGCRRFGGGSAESGWL